MRQYVKFCPVHRHKNPEFVNICEECGAYLSNPPELEPVDAPSITAPPIAVPSHSAQPYSAPLPVPPTPPILPTPPGQFSSFDLPTPPRQPPMAAPPSAIPDGATQRGDEPGCEVTLRHEGSGQRFTVRNGWRVGRHDATGPAEVKLSGFPGCEQVHRQHCRFERNGQQWFLVSIDQRAVQGPNAFTNVTYVNGRAVPPGGSEPLRHGDTITLCRISLTVLLPNEGR